MTFIMMGKLYAIIFITIFLLFATMGIIYGLFNFSLFVKSWLYDEDVVYFAPDFFESLPLLKDYLWDQYRLGAEHVTSLSIIPFVYGLVIGFLWPIFLLCGSVYLPLYSLRGFIRFKTKVNKAMENTDKEGHTHEY